RARGRARHAMLAEAEWLLPAPGGAIYNIVASRLALENLPAPRVVIETTSVFVTIELLNRSNLLAILPRNVARSYERAGKLAIVPIHLSELPYPMGIMFRRESAETRLVRMLITAARAAAAMIESEEPRSSGRRS
ncbi:MAG: LysR substrate-binding domain-containing protein, partial [Burkholderiaceae bacterium]